MISRARVGACVSEESRRCSLGATHAADRHQRCASDGSWALVMALRRAPSCYLILKAQCLITYCVATVSSEQCAAHVDGTPPQTAYRLGRDLATPRVAVQTWTSPSNSLLHQERLPSNSYLPDKWDEWVNHGRALLEVRRTLLADGKVTARAREETMRPTAW